MTPPLAGLMAEIHPLATANAALNATATVLLIAGWMLIRRGHVAAHRRAMLSAYAVSIVFLVSYLAYHVWPVGALETSFPGSGAAKTAYLTMLASHVVLAMTVPVLTTWTICLGLRNNRQRHRRWARWTMPIWLYVSITGVLIYYLLYHVYP